MGRHAFFQYREEEPRRGGSPVPRPTVDLHLATPTGAIALRALVDTGAPYCVFGNAVALALDVDLVDAPRRGESRDQTVHLLGDTHRARFVDVGLELPPFDGLSWTAEVGFLHDADLPISFAGVLGQTGFLDRWVASFNFCDGYFVVEEHESFIERLTVDPWEELQRQDADWQRPTRD